MKSFKQFLSEDSSKTSQYLAKLPPEPGSKDIPENHIRLFHQTTEANLDKIQKDGLTMATARGIEGPKGIWHHPKGFYGKPEDEPTVEFSIPKDEHKSLFGGPLFRDVKLSEIIAIHKPWHKHARYIAKSPSLIQRIKSGEFDQSIKNNPDDDVSKAVQHIKDNY